MGFSRVPLSVPSPLCTVPCPVPLTPRLFLPPNPAALAFRTVTATVWMRCHSCWEELRGVHSGKPVTAGTQPEWEGNKSTSIPGAPFLPVQFKWFKHCFFHYWEKTIVHATTNYSLNFAILTILKKRIRHRHVLGLTCSEETQWRFERGRSRLGFRFSGLFGFLFLFKLNGQVTDFTGEASVSFKNR